MRLQRQLFLSLILLFLSTVYADDYVASIPFITEDQIPQIDGKLTDDIWKEAAHICNIKVKGSGLFSGVNKAKETDYSPKETDFFICYDEEHIYIAAKCYEDEKGYPESYKRQSQSALIHNDDSVMFVIGGQFDQSVTGEVLNMGGYDGAYAKLTDAQFYYTYTVNSVGAQMRTFNETPLKRSLFDSATAKDGQYWFVEMKIPFSSSGLDKNTNNEVFANLIRIRPPDMMGWYLPRYGHYVDMPLGKFVLLDKGNSEQVTKERIQSKAVENTPVEYNLDIGYYPLAGSIAGIISQNKSVSGNYAIMKLTGFEDKRIDLGRPSEYFKYEKKQSAGINQEPDIKYIKYDIDKGTQKIKREAVLTLFDKDGKKLQEKSRILEPVEAPHWFGAREDIGVEYINEKVLNNWTDPVLKGSTISLSNKDITIGKNGLFEKIITEKGVLLGGAGKLIVEQNGKNINFVPEKQEISKDGAKVYIYTVLKADEIVCEIKTVVDYDGFTVVKLRFKGIDQSQISRVAFEISIDGKDENFLYTDIAENVFKLDQFGFNGLAGQTWIGGYDGGIGFDFDTYDLFLSENRRKQIVVSNDSGSYKFTANFVDNDGQIKRSDQVFRFFLLPTPTKNPDREKVREKYRTQWETWTPFQGYPDTKQIPKLGKWIDSEDMKDCYGLLYVGHGLQMAAPYHEEFQDDFEIYPQKLVYWRGGRKPQNACYLTSKLGPAADQQLWEMNKIVSEINVSGVISDGFSMPWDDYNPSHEGNVYQRAVWEEKTPSRIVLMRDYLKQYMGMFENDGRVTHHMDHTGGSFRFMTSTLFDSYLDGEPLARFKHGYQLPLEKFFAFLGQPWGTRHIFWEKRWRRKRGIFWSFTYGFLHDIETSNDSKSFNYKIFKEFDTPETVFTPYWKNNKFVKLESDNSLVSTYINKNAALVAVGDFTFYDDNIHLDLSKLFDGQDVIIQDMLTGEILDHESKKVTQKLEAWKLLLLKVWPETATQSVNSEKFAAINGYNSENWQIINGNNVIVSKDEKGFCHLENKGDGGVKIQLNKGLVSPDKLYAKLNFVAGNNKSISFTFDEEKDVVIKYTKNIGWAINSEPSLWNSGFCKSYINLPNDEAVSLEWKIVDGLINFNVDGEPVVVDYKMPKNWKPSTVLIESDADGFAFCPVEISSKTQKYKFKNMGSDNVVNSFDIDNWKASEPNRGAGSKLVKLNGNDAIQLTSRLYGDYSRVKFNEFYFGQDAEIHLKVQFNGRMNICLGSVVMKFYNGFNMLGDINGWNEGYINSNVKSYTDKPNDIMISVNNGVFNVIINGVIAARGMHFDLPDKNNILRIETWAGDNVTMDVVEISNKTTQILQKLIILYYKYEFNIKLTFKYL